MANEQWVKFKSKEDMPLDTVLLVETDTDDEIDKYQTSYFTKCENSGAIMGLLVVSTINLNLQFLDIKN